MMRTPLLKRPASRTHLWWCVSVLLFFASVRTAAALDVGRIVELKGAVDFQHGKDTTAAKENLPIFVGDGLFTRIGGMANLGFFPGIVKTTAESASVIVAELRVGESSHVMVAKEASEPLGPPAQFLLLEGSAQLIVAKTTNGCEIKTGTAVARAFGTSFIVISTAAMTKVVGVSGVVQVIGRAASEATGVFVSPQYSTEVAKGKGPTPPEPVANDRFRHYIEGLEFIGGGRAASLTAHDPLRTGAKVPPEDLLAGGVSPPPDPLDPCFMTSAPTCIPDFFPIGGFGNLDIKF